ncbi:MAG: hypothetical protein ACD_78C00228G0002, partial [uncultured bacterium (gcode 4)]
MKNIGTIFAVLQIISYRIFTIHHHEIFIYSLAFNCIKSLPSECKIFISQHLHLFEIFFFRIFLIFYVILFPNEIITEETVATIFAIIQKWRVPTVTRIYAVHTSETSFAIEDLVTLFQIGTIQCIDDRVRIDHPRRIHGFFHYPSGIHHITILHLSWKSRIFRVLRTKRGGEIQLGHFLKKCIKLPKESFSEIKFLSVIHRIPFITPPIFFIVDGIWFIRRAPQEYFHASFHFARGVNRNN